MYAQQQQQQQQLVALNAIVEDLRVFYSSRTDEGMRRQLEAERPGSRRRKKTIMNIEARFAEIKRDPQAWRIALEGISGAQKFPVEAKFFFLDVLDHGIRYHWLGGQVFTSEDRLAIMSGLLRFGTSASFTSPASGEMPLWKKSCSLLVAIGMFQTGSSELPDFFEQVLNIARSSQTMVAGVVLLSIACEEFRTLVPAVSSSNLVQSSAPRSLPILAARRKQLRGVFEQAIPKILTFLSQHLHALAPQLLIAQQQRQQQLSPALNSVIDAFDALDSLVGRISLQQFAESGLASVILTQYVFFNNIPHGARAIGCIQEAIDRPFIPKDLEPFVLEIAVCTMKILDQLTSALLQQRGASRGGLDKRYVCLFTQFVLVFLKNHLDRILLKGTEEISSFLTSFYNFTLAQPALDPLLHCLDGWLIFLERVNDIETKLSEGQTLQAIQITPNDYKSGLQALASALFNRIIWRQSSATLSRFMDDDDGQDSDIEDENGGANDDNLGSKYRSNSSGSVGSKSINGNSQVAGKKRQKNGRGGDDANGNSGGDPGSASGEEVQMLQELDSSEQNMPISERYVLSQRVLELISKIAELPLSSSECLDPILKTIENALPMELSAVSRSSSFDGGNTPPPVSSTIPDDIIAARDISTYFSLIAHVLPMLIVQQEFIRRFKEMDAYARVMIEVARYASTTRIQTRGPDFVILHESALFCLARLHPWFRAFKHVFLLGNQPPTEQAEYQAAFDDIMQQMIAEITRVLDGSGTPFPERVMLASTNLFYAMGARIVPYQALNWIPEMMVSPSPAVFCAQLPLRAQERYYIGLISSVLVLCDKNNVQQASVPLQSLLRSDIETLPTPDTPNVVPGHAQQRSLCVLATVIRSVEKAETFQRWAVLSATQPALSRTVFIAQISAREIASRHGMIGVLIDALGLIQAFFDSLRKQLAPEEIKSTLASVVALFQNDSPIFTPSTAGSAQNRFLTPKKKFILLSRLLELFASLMQESTNAFDAFIPDILNITLNSIYDQNKLDSQFAIDIFPSLFSVIRYVLAEHWNWFTCIQVQDQSRVRVIVDTKYLLFTHCMQAVIENIHSANGYVLPPDLVRYNLETLIELDKKNRLFQFHVFVNEMRSHFMNVLITTIVNRSQMIVEEEMLMTLHAIVTASSGSPQDLISMLRAFLDGNASLPQEPKDVLLRNLSNSLDQLAATQKSKLGAEVEAIDEFMNDLRTFQMLLSF